MHRVSVVVEGASDEGAIIAILRECGLDPGIMVGRQGKDYIRININKYNQAAKFSPWFVVVDLDNPAICPAELRSDWLRATESDMFVFRIAVVEIESWLLADRANMATFLGVSQARVPLDPDKINQPKEYIVNLARKSKKRDIREGLVPRTGSGAVVGPTYASDIREFGANIWDPAVAAQSSPSLARCIDRLRELADRLRS